VCVNWGVKVGVRDFLLFCGDLVNFQASGLKRNGRNFHTQAQVAEDSKGKPLIN
jgi:hypothetical protein